MSRKKGKIKRNNRNEPFHVRWMQTLQIVLYMRIACASCFRVHLEAKCRWWVLPAHKSIWMCMANVILCGREEVSFVKIPTLGSSYETNFRWVALDRFCMRVFFFAWLYIIRVRLSFSPLFASLYHAPAALYIRILDFLPHVFFSFVRFFLSLFESWPLSATQHTLCVLYWFIT